MTAPAATVARSTPSRPPRSRATRPAPTSRRPRRPSDLPREYRIAYVYRTLGRGLVTEYDPD